VNAQLARCNANTERPWLPIVLKRSRGSATLQGFVEFIDINLSDVAPEFPPRLPIVRNTQCHVTKLPHGSQYFKATQLNFRMFAVETDRLLS
jgi:hypothetical protein